MVKDILDKKVVFKHFDAPQILKHILYLKTKYKDDNIEFKLILLWYKHKDAEENEKIKEEMDEFQRYIKEDGIDFKIMTYQELFAKLEKACGTTDEHKEYLDYLRERYFKP